MKIAYQQLQQLQIGLQAIPANKIANLLLNLSQNFPPSRMEQNSMNQRTPEKKKQGIDYHRRQEIKQRIDSLLENDFEVLRRGDVKSDDLIMKNHNLLVLEYVKSIYEEYYIQDPLPYAKFLSRITLTPSLSKTKKKNKKIKLISSQVAKNATPARQDKQKKNIDEQENDSFDFVGDETTVKKDYFHNTTTIRASLSCFDAEQRDRSASNILPTDYDNQGFHQILRSRQKNGLQMIVEDELRPDAEEEGCSPQTPHLRAPNQEKAIQEEEHEDSFFVHAIPALQQMAQSVRIEKQPLDIVDESFRYCIGCERPLLQANLQSHQSTCLQFQRVFRLAPEEIVDYLKTKVIKFQQAIKEHSNQLTPDDVDRLQQSSMRMMKESRVICSNGTLNEQFEREYFRVIDISKKWCSITEEINKVNWFLKIRQKIRQKFHL